LKRWFKPLPLQVVEEAKLIEAESAAEDIESLEHDTDGEQPPIEPDSASKDIETSDQKTDEEQAPIIPKKFMDYYPAPGRIRHVIPVIIIFLGVIGLGWTMYLNYFIPFKNSGSPIERHTYASSHTEFHNAMNFIDREAFSLHKGYDTPLAFQGTLAWPMHWYVRRYHKNQWTVKNGSKAQYILVDNDIYWKTWKTNPPDVLTNYEWTRIRFRHYWQPGIKPVRWDTLKRSYL